MLAGIHVPAFAAILSAPTIKISTAGLAPKKTSSTKIAQL